MRRWFVLSLLVCLGGFVVWCLSVGERVSWVDVNSGEIKIVHSVGIPIWTESRGRPEGIDLSFREPQWIRAGSNGYVFRAHSGLMSGYGIACVAIGYRHVIMLAALLGKDEKFTLAETEQIAIVERYRSVIVDGGLVEGRVRFRVEEERGDDWVRVYVEADSGEEYVLFDSRVRDGGE